jgi:hypothetical protein
MRRSLASWCFIGREAVYLGWFCTQGREQALATALGLVPGGGGPLWFVAVVDKADGQPGIFHIVTVGGSQSDLHGMAPWA